MNFVICERANSRSELSVTISSRHMLLVLRTEVSWQVPPHEY